MNKNQPPAPARIQVIQASEAPIAVIFRRGPTHWVRLLLWHTDTDTFEYGQWFRGFIEPAISDLTPDGSKLVYFARKYDQRHLEDNEYTFAWTAVSRPPFLTALALWPEGSLILKWGGGRFIDNNTLCRNNALPPHPDHLPVGLNVEYDEHCFSNNQRDTWKMTQKGVWDRGFVEPRVWQKSNDMLNQTLIKQDELYRNYHYYLLPQTDQPVIPLTNVDWVDWDKRNRLLIARQGQILSAQVQNGGLQTELIADFNDMRPERIMSPEQAREW